MGQAKISENIQFPVPGAWPLAPRSHRERRGACSGSRTTVLPALKEKLHFVAPIAGSRPPAPSAGWAMVGWGGSGQGAVCLLTPRRARPLELRDQLTLLLRNTPCSALMLWVRQLPGDKGTDRQKSPHLPLLPQWRLHGAGKLHWPQPACWKLTEGPRSLLRGPATPTV